MELVLSFYHLDPREHIQAIWFGGNDFPSEPSRLPPTDTILSVYLQVLTVI